MGDCTCMVGDLDDVRGDIKAHKRWLIFLKKEQKIRAADVLSKKEKGGEELEKAKRILRNNYIKLHSVIHCVTAASKASGEKDSAEMQARMDRIMKMFKDLKEKTQNHATSGTSDNSEVKPDANSAKDHPKKSLE